MEFLKARAPEAPSSLEHSLSTAPWNQATPLPPQPSWPPLQQQAFGSGRSQPVASALPTPSGLVNTLSIPEYRSRIIQIYSVHRPDNVEKIDYLLQKYAGEEEFLYQSICQKYSIDPAIGLPQSAPAAATPAPRPPPPPKPPPWATAGKGSRLPVVVKPPARQGWQQKGGGLQHPGFVPPPPAPAPTRAGLGYNQPSVVVPPRVQHEVPQPAPAPVQKHEVMEWDPAKGEMVATTVDLQSSEIQELMGIVSDLKPLDQCQPAQEASAASLVQPWKPAMPPPRPAPPARKEQDDYDPFSAEPVQTRPSKMLDMVEIDYLLMGERSGFFDEVGTGISRVSTADAMEVDGVSTADAMEVDGAAPVDSASTAQAASPANADGAAPADSACTAQAASATAAEGSAPVDSASTAAQAASPEGQAVTSPPAGAVDSQEAVKIEDVETLKVANSAGVTGRADMETEEVEEIPLASDPYLSVAAADEPGS